MFACRDSTPHKTCPANLRGLKPVTAEPWAYDAQVYAEKTGSFERVVNADMFGTGSTKLEEYNDESIYDSNNPDEVRAIGSRTTSLSERSVQESPIHMSMEMPIDAYVDAHGDAHACPSICPCRCP